MRESVQVLHSSNRVPNGVRVRFKVWGLGSGLIEALTPPGSSGRHRAGCCGWRGQAGLPASRLGRTHLPMVISLSALPHFKWRRPPQGIRG